MTSCAVQVDLRRTQVLRQGLHRRARQAHDYSTLLESEMEEELREGLGKSWRAQEIVNLKS